MSYRAGDPPISEVPRCCPDAGGGDMVRFAGGSWLCVWCERTCGPEWASMAVDDDGRLVPLDGRKLITSLRREARETTLMIAASGCPRCQEYMLAAPKMTPGTMAVSILYEWHAAGHPEPPDPPPRVERSRPSRKPLKARETHGFDPETD